MTSISGECGDILCSFIFTSNNPIVKLGTTMVSFVRTHYNHPQVFLYQDLAGSAKCYQSCFTADIILWYSLGFVRKPVRFRSFNALPTNGVYHARNIVPYNITIKIDCIAYYHKRHSRRPISTVLRGSQYPKYNHHSQLLPWIHQYLW